MNATQKVGLSGASVAIALLRIRIRAGRETSGNHPQVPELGQKFGPPDQPDFFQRSLPYL